MSVATSTAIALGVGAASAGASVAAARMQSNAANNAARIQGASQDRAQGFNQQVYSDQQRLLNPYVQAGNDSLSRLMAQHWGSGGLSPGMRGTATSYGMQETPNSQYAPPPPGSRAPGMGSNIPPNVAAPRFGAQMAPQGPPMQGPPQGGPNPLAMAMGGGPPQGAPPPQAAGGAMVKLQAPDGSIRPFPADQANAIIQQARSAGHELKVVA